VITRLSALERDGATLKLDFAGMQHRLDNIEGFLAIVFHVVLVATLLTTCWTGAHTPMSFHFLLTLSAICG
jgi:hypothetical protein